MTWRAHHAPFRGALVRAARERTRRTLHALHPPSGGRERLALPVETDNGLILYGDPRASAVTTAAVQNPMSC